MSCPQFDYRLKGEPLTWEHVKARQVEEERQARKHMEDLLNWRPHHWQRKTQSGVPAIPLKRGSE